MSEEQVRQSLQFAIWRLESMFTWNNDTVSQTLMDLASQMEIKLRDFMPAFFIANLNAFCNEAAVLECGYT